MQIGVIFGLLFGLLIAFFAVMNTETVVLNYYFGNVETSVALLVLASAICGAITIGLFSFLKQVRAGFAIWDFRNKSRRLSKEVESLKEQKRALADDLSFLQAEYENKVREKEAECENLIKTKEEELDSLKEEKKLPDDDDSVLEHEEPEEQVLSPEKEDQPGMNGNGAEHNNNES